MIPDEDRSTCEGCVVWSNGTKDPLVEVSVIANGRRFDEIMTEDQIPTFNF